MNNYLPTVDRFWAKVNRDDLGGCWPWTAAQNHAGYGCFQLEGRTVKAHRFAYEQLVESIPPGLTIDHLCRNRACVNPDHLEPVTNRENSLRGIGPTAQNAAKTHCPQGHPYDEANTARYSDGSRRCRECNRCNVRRFRYARS